MKKELLTLLSNMTPEEITESYQGISEEFKSYEDVLDVVFPLIKDDVHFSMSNLLTKLNELTDSPECYEQVMELLNKSSRHQFRMYESYLAAGFNEDQAMRLLLNGLPFNFTKAKTNKKDED